MVTQPLHNMDCPNIFDWKGHIGTSDHKEYPAFAKHALDNLGPDLQCPAQRSKKIMKFLF